MQKWPNFFVVGAPKAGTSSLYTYLKKTEGVYMSPVAEPHYFSPVTADLVHFEKIREKNDYLILFKDAKDEKAIGECSPLYLQDPKTPELIQKTIPHAKIIISLRDPLERAFSHYLMLWRIGNFIEPFNVALRKFAESKEKESQFLHSIIEPGFYYESIKRYLDIFGQNQVKIIIFEEFVKNTRKTILEILNFLNVCSKPPENIDEIYNPYLEPRGRLADSIIRNKIVRKFAKKTIKQSTSWNIIKNFLSTKKEKPKLSLYEKEKLWEIYEDDVIKLKKLLKRPLPWSYNI